LQNELPKRRQKPCKCPLRQKATFYKHRRQRVIAPYTPFCARIAILANDKKRTMPQLSKYTDKYKRNRLQVGIYLGLI
jgi:hypothetical protein